MMNPSASRSQLAALVLLPIILIILAALYLIVVPLQGRPFLYRSRRMRDADESFWLYKVRTMQSCESTDETVLGGHQMVRVTSIGRVLRRTRLDELPQLFNVLRGDIGFIGPRPPLPRHVAAAPAQFRQLLSVARPGITGLSTVMLHRREARVLARCHSEAETERVYLSLCLPVKLRLDMLYAKRRSLGLDLAILWWTLARLLPSRRRAAPVPMSEQNAQFLAVIQPAAA